MPSRPLLVVEDDRFLRVLQVLLDPDTPAERYRAFADFFAHEEPDFDGYCARVRTLAGGLFPVSVRMVETQDEMRRALADAQVLVVEALAVGHDDIAAAPKLKLVQKYGLGMSGIDEAACTARGVRVLTIRRRANIACAEHAIALMLVQARKLHRMIGRISPAKLAEEGHPYRPFDRRHTPNSNWGRVPGIRLLHGAALGIIGLGEIGREIAVRAAAFGMRIVYFQRRQLPAADERALDVTYAPLDVLLAESDWLVTQLPEGPSTQNLIGAEQLARLKPGAFIVNVSRPGVIDRAALIDALRSGRLGGFALDPLYEAPGRDNDELLQFKNVILTPHLAAQPRWNALHDFADMVEGMARAFASKA
ncbi:MAG TPA: NAD(P)-dependent oxidoreductase [Xanthomonadaceae bacterium]|nr:NAD(P)-dependent oxidoreductase [Xanthomonadaceae bacterium]